MCIIVKGVFLPNDDALTKYYTKTLNNFFKCFVNTTSDFDKIHYWRALQNFIWRYRTYQLSDYRLVLSFIPTFILRFI